MYIRKEVTAVGKGK